MDKIKSQLEEIHYLISKYDSGPDVCDYDKTLVQLEMATEKLLMEVAIFKALIKTKDKITKIVGRIKAKRIK